MHINYGNEKIMYLKELGLDLSEKDLMKLEIKLERNGQLKDNKYLYYDVENIIRVKKHNV
jgi:hypothetical protein